MKGRERDERKRCFFEGVGHSHTAIAREAAVKERRFPYTKLDARLHSRHRKAASTNLAFSCFLLLRIPILPVAVLHNNPAAGLQRTPAYGIRPGSPSLSAGDQVQQHWEAKRDKRPRAHSRSYLVALLHFQESIDRHPDRVHWKTENRNDAVAMRRQYRIA